METTKKKIFFSELRDQLKYLWKHGSVVEKKWQYKISKNRQQTHTKKERARKITKILWKERRVIIFIFC